MAKKSRATSRTKAKAKAKLQTEAVGQPEFHAPPQIDDEPASLPKKRTVKVPILFAVGALLLLIGVIWVFTAAQQRTAASSEVKNQTIPMTLDDFSDDPALHNVIQKQLGGSTTRLPSPQLQPEGSPQSAGATLQSSASSLQQQAPQ